MTLRERLTQSYLLVALIGLLLASFTGLFLVRNEQVRTAERSVRLIRSLVSVRLDATPALLDAPAAQQVLQRLANVQNVRVLAVDNNGTVLRDSQRNLEGRTLPLGNLLAQPAVSDAGAAPVRRVRFRGDLFFVSVLPIEAGGAGQRWLIAVPAATLLDSWLLLLPGTLLRMAVGLAVAGLVGWSVSRRLTRPVEALTLAARRLAQGQYDVRVEPVTEFAELDMLATTFNTMADEVRAAREAQRDFLANVSHDLRTPLTSIQGFSQALMDGTVTGAETPRIAGIIHTEAGRLTRLVQELLEVARMDAGSLPVALQEIDLRDVLDRCDGKFQPQAEAMGVQFQSALPAHPLLIRGDADRLERVLTNLLDNAFHYARQGGGHVWLVAHKWGDTIEIRVEDDGPGLPDEHKTRIFERFYRADTARRGGGAGLGLAIAREIVQAHGGTLHAEDRAEQGTRLVIRLPAPPLQV